MNTTSGIRHLHRVTYTRRCIHTNDSPDDEHGVARNMLRIVRVLRNKHKRKRNCASRWLSTRTGISDVCYHSVQDLLLSH
jgi:hypothetical protein